MTADQILFLIRGRNTRDGKETSVIRGKYLVSDEKLLSDSETQTDYILSISRECHLFLSEAYRVLSRRDSIGLKMTHY